MDSLVHNVTTESASTVCPARARESASKECPARAETGEVRPAVKKGEMSVILTRVEEEFARLRGIVMDSARVPENVSFGRDGSDKRRSSCGP